MEKILTLTEIAEKLRVSKHTIQAWISPSSPNHRTEFAVLARHAGRKTVFLEEEVDAWLNQRKGAIYSQSYTHTSEYWRERFLEARGLFKGILKEPVLEKMPKKPFNSGKIALDYEPLIIWFTDSDGASTILNYVNKSDGIMLAAPLVWWFLRRLNKSQKQIFLAHKFFIEHKVFELAPLNEASLAKALELPATAGELSIQSYACTQVAGASALLTTNSVLLETKSLSLCNLG